MSIRPKPTFNGQCPISCIAVLEEKDLIATLNYCDELEIRTISNQSIIFQKNHSYAKEMHFLGENLLIYDQYYFTLLDWKNNIILREGNGFVFSNLQYYLTYQDSTFQLLSFFDDAVHWENKNSEVDSFSAKMANESIFLKIEFNCTSNYQIWNLRLNKAIDFKDCIKKEINLTIEDYLLDDSQFINEGKEILIEQFVFNCWRVIVFSIESLKVVENLILGKYTYLHREDYRRIFCYKNQIYFHYDENQLMRYDKNTKRLNALSLKTENSIYFSFFVFNEKIGVVYLIGQDEILTLQIDSGLKFLIKFDLPFRIDEGTLFSNYHMYASSFSGGLIKVDLKTKEFKNICYNSDEVHDSQILKNKISILSNNNSVTIWDLNLNKPLKIKNINTKNYTKFGLVVLPSIYDKFRFQLTDYPDKFIEDLDYGEDGETKLFISNHSTYLKNLERNSTENVEGQFILNYGMKNIKYCSSTTNWIKEAPEFFESKGSAQIYPNVYDSCIYIAKEALYKINLKNGHLEKGVEFRKFDGASCMQITNEYLFLGMDSFCIYIIDLKKFEVIHKISTVHESSHSLLFCPKRNILFVGSSYCQFITIYDVLTGNEIHSWQAHKRNLSKLFFLEDQNALLSICQIGSIKKWDYNTFELLDEYYSLPTMPDKKYRKGWAHIDKNGKLNGSKNHKEYFNVKT